jgi:hypothetical protein
VIHACDHLVFLVDLRPIGSNARDVASGCLVAVSAELDAPGRTALQVVHEREIALDHALSDELFRDGMSFRKRQQTDGESDNDELQVQQEADEQLPRHSFQHRAPARLRP